MTPEQVERYWKDGFLFGIPILSEAETADFRARFEALEAETVAAHGGEWEVRDFYPRKSVDHPFRELYEELATLPRLLDVVEAVLGPNLLIRNGDIFIKEPGVARGIAWHIDTAERDGTEDGMLTAWLGLGVAPVGERNGGLRFLPGGHRVAYPDAPKDKFNLNFSNTAKAAIDLGKVVQTEMPTGHLSLHHACMPHLSRYNKADTRRIGFVLRFMTPQVTRKMAGSGEGKLVRGTDVGPFSPRDYFPVSWRPQTPASRGEQAGLGALRALRRKVQKAVVRWRAGQK